MFCEIWLTMRFRGVFFAQTQKKFWRFGALTFGRFRDTIMKKFNTFA